MDEKTNYSILLILKNLLFKNSLIDIKVVSSLATHFSYNLLVLTRCSYFGGNNCPSKRDAICKNFKIKTEGTVKQCIQHTSHMKSHKCIVVKIFMNIYIWRRSSGLIATLNNEISQSHKLKT